VRISDQALEAAVDLSMRFDSSHMLPDKAIRLLDTACAEALITSLTMGSIEDTLKEVTPRLVAETMATRARLPQELVAGHIEGMPLSRLLGLQPFLSERLVGQDEVIERVCHRLFVAYAGLEKRKGPLAVFLFMGPTGVGKTRMAKLLAEFFFGKDSEMIRLDMSEFSEESSVARLIGSPPGYVGYGDGQLVQMLREKHHSVVLFDEVEKANPKVFDIFLQLFDEGRITDSKGRTADARNAIFIMTSNLEPEPGLSYDDVENRHVHRGMRVPAKKGNDLKIFRRELVNRMDEVIVFNSLDYNAIGKILENVLKEKLAELDRNEHVSLRISDEAQAFIAAAGYRPEDGVRALERAVSRHLYEPLSKLILAGHIGDHERWLALYDERGIYIEPDN
jgi:ATP-dependent Clp protease ATP-binding subunit ClpA